MPARTAWPRPSRSGSATVALAARCLPIVGAGARDLAYGTWWPHVRRAPVGAGSSLLLALPLAPAPTQRPLGAAAVTMLGGALFRGRSRSFLLALRHNYAIGARPGRRTALVFFPLVITWISDTRGHVRRPARSAGASSCPR